MVTFSLIRGALYVSSISVYFVLRVVLSVFTPWVVVMNCQTTNLGVSWYEDCQVSLSLYCTFALFGEVFCVGSTLV